MKTTFKGQKSIFFDMFLKIQMVSLLLLVILGESRAEKDICEDPTIYHDEKAYEILVMMPFASMSHVSATTPLLKALAKKGHRFTFSSMYKLPECIPNTAEITLVEIHKSYEKWRPANIQPSKLSSGVIGNTTILLKESCHIMYQDERILSLQSKKFDLAIVDTLMAECTLALIHKLQIPFILLSTTSIYDWTAWSMNVPTPFSYVPQQMTPYSNTMSFHKRLINTATHLTYLLVRKFLIAPTAQKIVWEYFPDIPTIAQIEMNTSLVLVTSHPSLDAMRPTMAYVVQIGGMQCRPGNELPKDLEEFISEAGDKGFIYFSLGSNVRATDMSKSMIGKFVEAFSQLEQRVVWKFDADIPNLPANVILVKWAPQQDLLAHHSLRLFITHAGQLSTQEAVYHGVPVIAMPLNLDQTANAATLVRKGMGKLVQHDAMKTSTLRDAIIAVIGNDSCKENALKNSELFKDCPGNVVDTAVFWVEYVVRHKGARHMKSPAQHLNFLQYFLVDIIALFALIVTILMVIGTCTLRVVIRKIRGDYVSRAARRGSKSKRD